MKSHQLFPPLTPDVYALSAGNFPLLQLAATEIRPLQLALGTGLTPIGQLARLMVFHKKAFLAELAGEWKRADFYFEKCHHILKKISGKDAIWEQFKRKFQLTSDIGHLKQRIMGEIFIETHLAFFRSSGKDDNMPETQRQRSLQHLESAYQLAVNFQDFIPDDIVLDIYAQLFRQLNNRGEKNRVLKLIRQGKSGGRFDAFLTASERDIVFTKALKESHVKEAKLLHSRFRTFPIKPYLFQYNKKMHILKKAAKHIKLLHRELPDDLEWYNQLGQLYFLISDQQAKNGSLSKALLSIAKADAYNPHQQDLASLKMQLKEQMINLQEKMNQVKWQSSFTKHLTIENLRLMIESSAGFKLAKKFLNSRERQDILNARRASFKTSNSFFQREKPVTILFTYSMAALPVAATGKQKAETPFIFWLFSPQGWLAKTAAIAAMVLLGFTIFYTAQENLRLDLRDNYYSAIQQSIQQGEPLPVISSQVEGFMSNRPAFGADQRTIQVLDWYDKVFTNWFVQVETLDTPEAEKELLLFTNLRN